MPRLVRTLNILLIVLLASLVIARPAYAQGKDQESLLAPFAPILAASVAAERLLQLIRNIISPDPEKGLLARKSLALRYYTTIGGTVLGLLLAFTSDLRLLDSAGIAIDARVDLVTTGVTVGMGTEFVHEVIKVVAETKSVLRQRGQTPRGQTQGTRKR